MIKFIKNNKLFSFMIFISVIVFLCGVITCSIFDNNTKNMITENINNLILNIKDKSISTFTNFFKCFSNNILYSFIIWIFGISIFGLVFSIFLYVIKLFLFSIELISLFVNIKITGFLFNLIYIIPDIISIILLFIVTYYSISYSVVLFKFLFRKCNYSLKNITKRYYLYIFFFI